MVPNITDAEWAAATAGLLEWLRATQAAGCSAASIALSCGASLEWQVSLSADPSGGPEIMSHGDGVSLVEATDKALDNFAGMFP
jgi:hypothetical protein